MKLPIGKMLLLCYYAHKYAHSKHLGILLLLLPVSFVIPSCLGMPYVFVFASHLMALDKCPRIRPIRIGETLC